MSQNSNVVPVFLCLDLRLLINRECIRELEGDQLPATCILRLLTEHFKDQLPKEVYERLKGEYAMSAVEQRERNRLKEEESQNYNLERAYKQKARKLLDEIADCEMRLKKKDLTPRAKEIIESRLAEAKANLENLRE